MKLVGAAIVCALVVVPIAGADGVAWTITSGTAGDNGWYRSAVGIHVTAAGSGCPNVPFDLTFNTTAEARQFSCGSPPSVLQFPGINIDTDAPSVTGASPDRTPDKNGWYTHAVTVTFAGSDANSGLASCSKVTFGGPDNGSAAATGTCRDNAGNVSAPSSFSLKYDSTAPGVSATTSRSPNANGWYNQPFSVAFAGTDATSGVASCSTAASYSGPDTASGQASGTCTDQAGNTGTASFAFHYDATPPTVTATPSRKPDSDGWYNHPFSVAYSGGDDGSGIDSCTATQTYSGPQASSGQESGSCSDKAGNSASASFPFHYDSTPPTLTKVAAAIGDGTVTLSWRESADTANVIVTRTPGRGKAKSSAVYHGKASSFRDTGLKMGSKYRYTVSASDAAGNVAQVATTAAMLALFSPVPGQRVKAGATLAWIPAKSASYYNIQLFRKGKKVLSTWPKGPRFKLPRSWMFEGKHHKLQRGKYTWYVWPGLGARTKAHYGKLLGGSTFTVR
jgi:hypothetical protein